MKLQKHESIKKCRSLHWKWTGYQKMVINYNDSSLLISNNGSQKHNVFTVQNKNKSQTGILYTVKFISESLIFRQAKTMSLLHINSCWKNTDKYTSVGRKFNPERIEMQGVQCKWGAKANSHQSRELTIKISGILWTGC